MSRLAGIVLLVVAGAVAQGCALNRPVVKSLRDPGAARINFDQPIVTTISALNAIPSRCGPAFNQRVRDEEYRVYEVVGRITRVKREPDHDVHISIADPDNPRRRIIVEIKDPGWRGSAQSPYRDQLAAASRMFDAIVTDSGVSHVRELKGTLVRVTGVGFFDMNHFQIGRSKSCIELHPVLAIERIP
jgi:hypothetical protein